MTTQPSNVSDLMMTSEVAAMAATAAAFIVRAKARTLAAWSPLWLSAASLSSAGRARGPWRSTSSSSSPLEAGAPSTDRRR